MKTIRFKFGYNHYEDIEYDDDVTDEEIDNDLEEWCLNLSSWEEV